MIAFADGHYYEALIFDLYGTLVEIFKQSEYKDNLDSIIAALGVNPGRFAAAWKETWEAYPYGDYPSVEARFDSALERYHGTTEYPRPEGLQKAVKLRNDYIQGQTLKVKEGAIDALEWAAREGYKLGMVSNCSAETAMIWNESPLARYFPDPSLSCVLKLKKPEPEIFLNETNKLGVDPGHCIYVADGDDHELDTAMALGMATVLVTYDLEDAYRHQPFPESEHSITHFSQLPAAVMGLERARKRQSG
ncbi:MAG: HAD family hydrolase [Candidatus Lokiarchaeota archaeon]|nr:HAD family hydrolase [Candidatus Lokiarchaeota archaeon]